MFRRVDGSNMFLRNVSTHTHTEDDNMNTKAATGYNPGSGTTVDSRHEAVLLLGVGWVVNNYTSYTRCDSDDSLSVTIIDMIHAALIC
jgi:hypothetical protein